MVINSLILVAVAAVLFACGGLFIKASRKDRPKRVERLTIDNKLVMTNTKMKRIGV